MVGPSGVNEHLPGIVWVCSEICSCKYIIDTRGLSTTVESGRGYRELSCMAINVVGSGIIDPCSWRFGRGVVGKGGGV